MFETEAKKYQEEVILNKDYPHSISVDWQRGAEYGFQKGIKAKVNTTTISDCPIKGEWHNVSEQIPTEEKQYLLKFKDGTIDVLYVGIDGNLEPFIVTRECFEFYKDVEKWCEIPKED